MNGSWYWRWHGRRCFGPAHRSRRFGLWSWHHFADDSVGPKPRIVRVDGKECSYQSLPRYKENTVQLTRITPESAKRLFQPTTRTAVFATPIPWTGQSTEPPRSRCQHSMNHSIACRHINTLCGFTKPCFVKFYCISSICGKY